LKFLEEKEMKQKMVVGKANSGWRKRVEICPGCSRAFVEIEN
jgi:hypothetical protein